MSSTVNAALQTTLADVTRWLRDEGLPFAVIDGIAATFRGEARFTADVDLVVGIDLDQALQLLKRLSSSPFQPLFPEIDEVLRTSFLLPLRHTLTQVSVDIAVGMSGFERQAISRATEVVLPDCRVPIVSAEDLILMKLLANRPRDTDDVRNILLRQGSRLDWNYLWDVGQKLQQAVDQDLLSELQRLQANPNEAS
jgi:predicted nucleotidyltransferase